jgi:hypothetical protein
MDYYLTHVVVVAPVVALLLPVQTTAFLLY